jgi:hypothetical protein
MFQYTDIHAVLGEGNFVLTVSEGQWNGTTNAFYDLFRMEDGMIVEHWDVIQPVPTEGLANDNGMFTGFDGVGPESIGNRPHHDIARPTGSAQAGGTPLACQSQWNARSENSARPAGRLPDDREEGNRMPADELTPESFRQRPDVVRAVENPRSPRSVLNYMCGCDTAKPEIRDSLNQDETVRPLMTIWFQSGRTLDAFCQPFAPVVRELKADPPSLIGEDWNSLEGTAAKVLLADQLSRSCFRGSAEAFSYDPIARDLMRALMAPQMIDDTLTLPAAILYLLALGPGAF